MLEGPETVIGPDVEGKRDDVRLEEKAGKGGGMIGVTVVYYMLLVVGAWGWWRLLWVLSESEGALVNL